MKGGRSIIAVLLLFLLYACAVMEPPTGGPRDETPPSIVSTIPSQDSTNVSGDVEVQVIFSEKLDPESFKNRISTYPPVEFDDIDVDDEVLKVKFESPLPGTTFVFHLESGYRDDHRVEGMERLMLYFSTNSYMEKGLISGWTLFKEKPDSLGVVKLFRADGDTIGDFITEQEARVAYSDNLGKFSFRALPTDSVTFIVWAFSDRDDNGRYSESDDFAILQPDTVTLAERSVYVRELRLDIIDPDEPGSIGGGIENRTEVAGLPLVILKSLSAEGGEMFTAADSSGVFRLKPVAPGEYTLTALMDIKADSICGNYPSPEDSTVMMEEPCFTMGDTLRLKPGEKKQIEKTIILE